jgi:hypothetical protein
VNRPWSCADALYRPYFEQTNASGQHSYSRFLAALHAGWARTYRGISEELQVTEAIVERIRHLLPLTAEEHFARRISMSFALVAHALRIGDERSPDEAGKTSQLYFDAIRVAAAVLATPFATET